MDIHWLQKDKLKKIGSKEALKHCVDTNSSHTYTADHLDGLLEKAEH
jgi:hypothetical protein